MNERKREEGKRKEKENMTMAKRMEDRQRQTETDTQKCKHYITIKHILHHHNNHHITVIRETHTLHCEYRHTDTLTVDTRLYSQHQTHYTQPATMRTFSHDHYDPI